VSEFKWVLTVPQVADFLDPAKFSSLYRLYRVTAYLLRFVHIFCIRFSETTYFSALDPPVSGPVIGAEMRDARLFWTRYSQEQHYRTEIEALRSGEPVSPRSKLVGFDPFIDRDGLLRLGGRLVNSNAISDPHPIILPPEHPVTKLLVVQYHESMHHFGADYVIGNIRRRYWIPRLRGIVKRAIFDCRVCHRRRVETCVPIMSSLSSARVQESYPFSRVMVDYAGPVYVKRGRGREKRWICIFTCLATRAVHIELVCSLETDSFLMSFQRFVSRRGPVSEVYSDCGTTFIGADRELNEAVRNWNDDSKLKSYFSKQEVKWTFSPPKAPHLNGAVERIIKSCKRALNITLREQTFHEDVLCKTLCEIESTLIVARSRLFRTRQMI
jgi:hypothetical protein